MSNITQTEAVKRYIKEHGSITAFEAMSRLGIMRLASRISDLKAQGYKIKRELVKTKTRDGNATYIAKYYFGD